MPHVLLNADDLGLASRHNEGVHAAIEAGAVRRASLIVTTAGFDEGARLARRYADRVEVGLHFSLTEGRALTGPIRGVTDRGGHLRPLPILMAEAARGRIDLAGVEAELDAQWRRLKDVRAPTHLDGHQHAHALRGVRDVIARRFGASPLPIRVPRDVAWWLAPSLRVLVVSGLGRGLEAALARRARTRFTGLGLYRHPRFHDALRRVLRRVGPGPPLEVMVHPRLPARGDRVAAAELEALCDPDLLAVLGTSAEPAPHAVEGSHA